MRRGALWLLLLASQALAQSPASKSPFVDPQDGAFDASEWLLEKKGFLPVPIVITEPAVGYGGGAALIFFRESIGHAVERAKATGHVTPPDIYGVALAGTENGSRFLGAAAMITFGDDRWRYRGAVGKPQANLDFYGAGGELGTGSRSIAYSLDGVFSTQQALRRLGETNHFVAARWVYLDLEARFDPQQAAPPLQPHQIDQRSSGIGLAWQYDSRDNYFTPSSGWFAAAESIFYRPGIGSDHSFEAYRGRVYGYTPLGSAFVLGGRFDARTARGDVPFYQLPYLELRGMAALRYQDESTALVEAELRWNATPRWALVGFAGAGRAWGTSDDFGDVPTRTAAGAGVRYLIARKLGLYVGMDFAWSKDEEAFYLQAGSAWR